MKYPFNMKKKNRESNVEKAGAAYVAYAFEQDMVRMVRG
jgi:hypothetical protein